MSHRAVEIFHCPYLNLCKLLSPPRSRFHRCVSSPEGAVQPVGSQLSPCSLVHSWLKLLTITVENRVVMINVIKPSKICTLFPFSEKFASPWPGRSFSPKVPPSFVLPRPSQALLGYAPFTLACNVCFELFQNTLYSSSLDFFYLFLTNNLC